MDAGGGAILLGPKLLLFSVQASTCALTLYIEARGGPLDFIFWWKDASSAWTSAPPLPLPVSEEV